MSSKLSAYRMIEVWKQKSKHLNQDQPVVAAINNWLGALQEMEQEDDRVAEAEIQETQEREAVNWNDDIPF